MTDFFRRQAFAWRLSRFDYLKKFKNLCGKIFMEKSFGRQKFIVEKSG